MIRTVFCVVVILLVTFSVSFTMSKYQNDLVNKANQYIELTKKIPAEFGSAEFGDWERISAKPMQDYVAEELKVRDAEYWIYKNKKTGETVGISFLVGPTGRLSVHTPEICLSGAGLKANEQRVPETFDENSADSQNSIETDTSEMSDENKMKKDENQFWRVVIVDDANPNAQMVFYYALGTGKKWWALQNPRFELSHYPFILKMQVETMMENGDPKEYNAAHNFLHAFLPVVKNVFEETDLEGMYQKK